MKNFMYKNLNLFLGLCVLLIGAIVLAQIEMATGISYAMAIAGYTKSCTKNVAGNTAVWFAEVANVTSVTVTTGEISAIGGTAVFFKDEADIDTLIRTEEGTGTGNNMAYVHRVEAKHSKPSTALNTLRNSLADASPCGIVALIADANGTVWLVGWNQTDLFNRPLRLVQDSLNSGAAPADEEQAVTIALECTNGYVSLALDATLGASVLDGTATFLN